METQTLIIGAGLSGLHLGRKLAASNHPCIILEKSRGLGGRLATRRIEDLGFDHGSPYLNHSPRLIDFVLDLGLSSSLHITSGGIFVAGGMTKIPKVMAEHLRVEKSTRAETIERQGNKWIVKTDTHHTFIADRVVLTAPLPQALELLDKSSITYPEKFSEVTYNMAIMVLIISDKELVFKKTLPQEFHSITPMVERGLHPTGYLIRSTINYSEKNFNRTDEENLTELVTLFKGHLVTPENIRHQEIKKWRYVTPKKALQMPYAEVQKDLFLIGDAFQNSNALGALESAEALAKILI